MSITEFVNAYGKYAVEAGKTYNMNPVVILAVAAWESAWGTSYNASISNNLFGIKYSATRQTPYPNGKRVVQSTYPGDTGYYLTYGSVRDSFMDYALLITKSYASVAQKSFDVAAFASAFTQSKYMQANREPYRKFIVEKAPQLLAILNTIPVNPVIPVVSTSSGLALGGLLLGGGIAFLVYNSLSKK